MKSDVWWRVLSTTIATLDSAAIDSVLVGPAALILQGIEVPLPDTIDIVVQWDLFPRVLSLFQPVERVEKQNNGESILFVREEIRVHVRCHYNTVVATDPDRILIEHNSQQFWLKSLGSFVREFPPDSPYVQAIKAYWRTIQQKNSHLNERAWNQGAYEAWVHRFGTPDEAARRLAKDPQARLAQLDLAQKDVAGKRVINLLGSHGARAVELALLGADVTVVDISQENARYAQEVAQAAGVTITYCVADVLQMPSSLLNGSYDMVLMELGILHYFVDLAPLATVIVSLLRPGGQLVLQDFHPITSKLISSKGKKHKVTGNYFDQSLTETRVAFSKHLPEAEQNTTYSVQLRKWTLGEIVTAIAEAGMFIRSLKEEPNMKRDDIGLPKTFTLVAYKIKGIRNE